MFPAPPRPPLPPPCAPLPVHVPVGAVMAFMGTQTAALAGAGWMICDGTTLTRSKYPELFAVIGYTYSGSGAPGESFLLPDLQGYFLRGVDPAGKVNQDGKNGAVGSIQGCALQDHVHTYAQAVSSPAAGGQGEGSVTTGSSDTGNVVVTGSPPTPGVSQTETRPVNVYVYYIIKYTTGTWPWASPLGDALGG
jgi:microcystin-dependent protein